MTTTSEMINGAVATIEPGNKPKAAKKKAKGGKPKAERNGKANAKPKAPKGAAAELRPGQHLKRVYKGKQIDATVLTGGRLKWNGDVYSSLTALAMKITGAKSISGPGFFKLTAAQ
jgi:hypothetical protein